MLVALHGLLAHFENENSIIVGGRLVELIVFVFSGMLIYAFSAWATRAITVPELLKSLRK